MRVILLTSLIGATALVQAIRPAVAQSPYSYPYCLQIIGGPISCYYASLRLCWAATFDRGGICVNNPFRGSASNGSRTPVRPHCGRAARGKQACT
jgi:hypothetical protein